MAFQGGKKRGAIFFTVDTMIAAITFTLTVVVIYSFFIADSVTEDAQVVLNNYNDYLINTKMESFLTSYRDVYTDARNAKPDLVVYEQIAYLQNTGRSSSASSFAENITFRILPDHFGFQYMLDDTVVYTRSLVGGDRPSMNISTVILTYFIDKDNNVQGPNVTRISVWV